MSRSERLSATFLSTQGGDIGDIGEKLILLCLYTVVLLGFVPLRFHHLHGLHGLHGGCT